MATEQITNATERPIDEIIAELRASVMDKMPGADPVQTTEIIHDLVVESIK